MIDGEIAGAVQPCGLAGADIDGGFGMLDDGWPGDAKSHRHFQPLKHRGFGPRIAVGSKMRRRPGFGAAIALGLWIDGLRGASDRDHAERRQFDAGNTKAGALAIHRLVGIGLEQLDQPPCGLRRYRTVRYRHHQVVRLAAIPHVD